MADNNTPFSVRLEQEDKEKLIGLIEESGRSNKEFMGILINAYELNKAKMEIPDIAKDIEGLQALTQRINDYYINIGKRIEDTRKVKDLEFSKELEIYKNRIEGLKAENEKVSTDFTVLQQSFNNISADYENITKMVEQLQGSLNDKTLLVEEYKEKNDTMTGLLNDYKQYKTEVEEYKKLLADSQGKNVELSNVINQNSLEIQKLTNEIDVIRNDNESFINNLTSKHSTDLEASREKLELEKDRAILELQKQHQAELTELQQKHSKEIEEYQSKYKQLLAEMEKSKQHSGSTSQRKSSANKTEPK